MKTRECYETHEHCNGNSCTETLDGKEQIDCYGINKHGICYVKTHEISNGCPLTYFERRWHEAQCKLMGL